MNKISHGHEMWAPADYAPSWKEDFAALFIYTRGYPKMDTQKVWVFTPEELKAFAEEAWDAARRTNGSDSLLALAQLEYGDCAESQDFAQYWNGRE